ncbi:unnamed protein product [Cuscuta epithymum]|uniref:Glucose-1-phosphate adenylyltransferase/Bifunctional protein GlmU-like C-terminal hexapeptide domain-containing protein n=1 Tax=Cuscuta epithymum TaxID=186058 RepID=A0AAV0FV99_9ASTE|nr:unnamed protein product [Cuscuta epithymum]
MTSRFPRLAALRYFSSMRTLITGKAPSNIRYRGPLLPLTLRPFCSTCSHFSMDQSVFVHSSSGTDSRLNGCTDIEHEEFRKWDNGGGSFHKSSSIDPSAVIEIGAIVHSESVLAENVHVGSGSIIGPSVTVGQSTRIGYGVALTNCTVGDFCLLHSGVCVGQDGFGFFVDEQGNMVKKPQNLKVRIGNHVEIGANSCIDKGSWRDTVIGDHSKIDNLVQFADRSQCGYWGKLHTLWTSWYCWLSNHRGLCNYGGKSCSS